jgi:hypothetical protein
MGLSRREIRALRGPRAPADPWRPPPTLLEAERRSGPDGATAPALTVFLVGAECPFTCVFCDLWRHTLDGPTPPGALVAQLEAALAAHPALDLAAAAVKLYNASNFFERRAVPAADRRAIARLLRGAGRVVVECHPRLVGQDCFDFAADLGAPLEVAMGLETVHPEAFSRLNKGMELADFDAAAARLSERGVAVRAFVQIGVPYVPPAEAVEWAVRSVEHALAAGAGHVALIPTRGGGGAMEVLAERGDFAAPSLADLEAALDRALALLPARAGAVVTADLWDLETFARCPDCLPARRERLRRLNLTGASEPRVACPECRGGAPA